MNFGIWYPGNLDDGFKERKGAMCSLMQRGWHPRVCLSSPLFSPWSGQCGRLLVKDRRGFQEFLSSLQVFSDLVFTSSDFQGPAHVSAPGVTDITALCLAATQTLQWTKAKFMMKMNSGLTWETFRHKPSESLRYADSPWRNDGRLTAFQPYDGTKVIRIQ